MATAPSRGPYRIGLVGLGKIATDRHVPTIALDAAFELAGVADPVADLSALHGVPTFRSHSAMLANVAGLDAVAICTPPPARAEIALDALAAGCHVLLEKPPTPDLDALAAIAAAASAARRVAFTAWHSQFNPAVGRARDMLADLEADGDAVARVAMTWTEDGAKYHPGQDWIWRAGGFGVFDAGINGLSILTRILPRTPAIATADLTVPPGAAMPIAARISFGGGVAGEAVLDWRPEPGERREILVTTRAGVVLALTESGRRLSRDGILVLDGPRAEYPALYAHFATLLGESRSDVDAAPLALALAALDAGRATSS